MPFYDAWPNSSDVEVLLKSAAYWPDGTPDSAKVLYAQEEAAIGIAAAIDEFEHRTGWSPFWSPANTSSTRSLVVEARRFASSGVVGLNAGLLRLDSVAINGVAVPLNNTAFRAHPSDAIERGKPLTRLQFLSLWAARFSWSSRPVEIAVTGRWGYCTEIPHDVWGNVLQYGAVIALSQLENQQSIGSISQDGFSKSFDIVGILQPRDLAGPQGIWGKNFEKCCEHYKRVALY